MDISAVNEYMDIKKQQAKLQARLATLQKTISGVEAKEAALSSKIDPDGLITAKAIRIINKLLNSHYPLWLNGFPVSLAHFTLKNKQLRLSATFEQPVFSGWHTEIPYLSYQLCPLSLETPEPPTEYHIPEYTQDIDYRVDVVCWEQGEDRLLLWIDPNHKLEFMWESN